MPVNWQDVITNIGTTAVSATVVVGAVAWMIKTALSHRLARQAEEFKNSLQTIALEHQVRFSKLHERRAEVIEQLYQLLVGAHEDYRRYLLVSRYATDAEKLEALRKADTTMRDASFFIERHRIYLPAGFCDLLTTFLDVTGRNVNSVSFNNPIDQDQPTSQTRQERHNFVSESYQALEKEILAARTALEGEFRKLLGG